MRSLKRAIDDFDALDPVSNTFKKGKAFSDGRSIACFAEHIVYSYVLVK